MSILDIFLRPKAPAPKPCNLRIGPSLDALAPVNDQQGLGGYQLAIEKLLREQAPDRVYLLSDDTNDLSVVRKGLAYLGACFGEIAVCPQLPEAEVAAALGLDVRMYRATLEAPNGDDYGRLIPDRRD